MAGEIETPALRARLGSVPAQPRAWRLRRHWRKTFLKRRQSIGAYRSPGVLRGYWEVSTLRSSAVRTMRLCSAACAAG